MAALDASHIKYLIVGGIAVGFYAEPRFTKDLDILVAVQPPDHLKLFSVLREFGAPVHLVAAEEFVASDFIFHFGLPPWRIDILTSIQGVDFGKAFERRNMLPLGTYMASVISKEDLIVSKLASGRHQDLADVEKLRLV